MRERLFRGCSLIIFTVILMLVGIRDIYTYSFTYGLYINEVKEFLQLFCQYKWSIIHL